MGELCRRAVAAVVLLAACTGAVAMQSPIECAVELSSLAKSDGMLQKRALSPDVIADGVPPLLELKPGVWGRIKHDSVENTLRGVDVPAEGADGLVSPAKNLCGIPGTVLCPRGFPCERDDQCSIGSICGASNVCAEFQPTPTAAFFDIGLVLLGVSPAAYIHLNLENVIREGVAASVGRGTSLSDVNVGAITPLLSWTCPALSVVLRVSLASPVVWSSIWTSNPDFSELTKPFIGSVHSSFSQYVSRSVVHRLSGFQVAEVAVSDLFGVFGTALHQGAPVEVFMQAEGAKLTERSSTHSAPRALQAMVCCDCPVDDTGEVLKLTRIETGTAVDKTDTNVTLGVSAGLFVGILSLIGLYKVWWKQYRARQHAQSLRWRRSRSAAGDVEMETFHTTRHMPSAASHILGTMSSPLPSPHATAAAAGVNFRRTTAAPPSTPTMGGTAGSQSAAKVPIHTVNPLIKAEVVAKVEEKRAAKWERVVDEEGDVYYYNPTTGQSSWTEPTDDA